MEDSKNLIIAITLSIAIIFGWNILVENPKQERYKAYLEEQKTLHPEKFIKQIENTQAPIAADVSNQAQIQKEAYNPTRVKIKDSLISGSIASIGSTFDDITLLKYKESENGSEDVHLLKNKNSDNSYFANLGFLSDNAIDVPNNTTNWQVSEGELTDSTPITLTYKSGDGITFTRTISIEDNYLFRIKDTITNNGNRNYKFRQYGLLNRGFDLEEMSYLILHEGPIFVSDNQLNEITFKDLEDKKETHEDKKGWIGFSDKYWLTAFIPQNELFNDFEIKHYKKNNKDRFQVDYLSEWVEVQKNGSYTFENLFFSGAKEITVLDKYNTKYDIELFDRAVDFGVLYFLTKPIFVGLNYINSHIHNFGIAIIILTIIIRIILFPMANRSFIEMKKMKELQPNILEIKEKHGSDRVKQQQEMMALYKKYQVKPMAGCLPMLMQIPVFFALYKVLFVTIEMRHAPFFGWVTDLSAPDPTSIFNLFGLLPYEPFMNMGIWPLLMGATMIIQQRFSPKPNDPAQEKMMKLLPYIFTFIFAGFPAGLVIYWTCNNILSILQQWLINRKHN